MYMSVAEAASKFHISKRRVQVLCEEGRISGADRVDGVWVIPADAKKPMDGRRKEKGYETQDLEMNRAFDYKNEKLNMAQVCERFSISEATVKNWIRLGKLQVNADGESFDKNYIDKLFAEIKSGKDNRLKSRRNKKSVVGKGLYRDYIKSDHNQELVEKIMSVCTQLSEDELRVILANFAIQLYQQSEDVLVSEAALLEGETEITQHTLFNELIRDLLGHVDVLQMDLRNIQVALKCRMLLVPFEDSLGFVYVSLRDLSHRKQTGAYYTPEKIVKKLIDHLKESVELDNKTVCDPCCGSGNFLIGLVENGMRIENVYGQDIDEISVCLTRINMFLLNDHVTKEQLYSHFICGNTFFDTFSSKFSVVLGNPPWGYDFDKEEASCLMDHYLTAKKKGMESYDLFVEKGLEMLEEKGYLAYVLPEAILSVTSHQRVRKLMVEQVAFRFVNYLGNIFSGVQCPAVILGIQNGFHGETKECKVTFGSEQFVIHEDRVPDATILPFNMNDEEYDCLQAISSIENAKYLANHAKFALGIVTGNNKEYVADTRKHGMEIVLKGSNIYRYGTKGINSYIQFVPEKFQQVAPTELYRAGEKLLYRFISEVPVFTYDSEQTLSLNSCNVLIPQIEGMDIKYILAILNSSVAAYFINKKYHSVKLLKSHIGALPIPMASREMQDEIVKMVDQMLISMKSKKNLYEEIDCKIMNLYALTENQKNTIRVALSEKKTFIS